jgi:hypothetical protein
MSNWSPIPEADLIDSINKAWIRMSRSQKTFWELIAIYPEKWTQHPYGDEGNGFWVVAIVGRWIVWFNDIEDGWNVSEYIRYGEFEDYCCNQDPLEIAIEKLANDNFHRRMGPPEPLAK